MIYKNFIYDFRRYVCVGGDYCGGTHCADKNVSLAAVALLPVGCYCARMGDDGFALILGIGFLISVWLLVYFALRRSYEPASRSLGEGGIEPRNSSFIVAAGLLAWFSAVAMLGRAGFFAQTPLIAPNIIFAFLFLFFTLRHFYQSHALRAIAERIPLHWMISVHVWRIGGVGFITLYYAGILPAEFAFPSGIGDVAVGIAAIAVAYFYFVKKSFSRTLAILWNYIGVVDLLLAVLLGILAYPEPFPPLIDGQMLSTSVSTGALASYPLVLIPLFAVPLSLLLHAFSLRVLKRQGV